MEKYIFQPPRFLAEPDNYRVLPVISRWAAFEVRVFSLMLLLNRRQRFFLVPVHVNDRPNRGWPRVLTDFTGLRPVCHGRTRRSVRANQFSLALLSKIVPTLLYWFYLFITRALNSPLSVEIMYRNALKWCIGAIAHGQSSHLQLPYFNLLNCIAITEWKYFYQFKNLDSFYTFCNAL